MAPTLSSSSKQPISPAEVISISNVVMRSFNISLQVTIKYSHSPLTQSLDGLPPSSFNQEDSLGTNPGPNRFPRRLLLPQEHCGHWFRVFRLSFQCVYPSANRITLLTTYQSFANPSPSALHAGKNIFNNRGIFIFNLDLGPSSPSRPSSGSMHPNHFWLTRTVVSVATAQCPSLHLQRKLPALLLTSTNFQTALPLADHQLPGMGRDDRSLYKATAVMHIGRLLLSVAGGWRITSAWGCQMRATRYLGLLALGFDIPGAAYAIDIQGVVNAHHRRTASIIFDQCYHWKVGAFLPCRLPLFSVAVNSTTPALGRDLIRCIDLSINRCLSVSVLENENYKPQNRVNSSSNVWWMSLSFCNASSTASPMQLARDARMMYSPAPGFLSIL